MLQVAPLVSRWRMMQMYKFVSGYFFELQKGGNQD